MEFLKESRAKTQGVLVTVSALAYVHVLKPPRYESHENPIFLKLVSVGFLSFATKSPEIEVFIYHSFTLYFIMPSNLYFRILKNAMKQHKNKCSN